MLLEITDEVTGQLVVACFLVREGASISTLNGIGQTPLDICSPEIAVIISTFAGKHAGYCTLIHAHCMYVHTNSTFGVHLYCT